MDSSLKEMAIPIGSINEYTRSENWSMWHERLEQYLEANEIKKDKKKALFLTLIGSVGYAILRNLCAPDLPKTKTYKGLSELMMKYMDPAPNEMLERFKFKQCRQKYGQEIKTFFEELKKTSTYCNFGANQNQNLRDQFVWGLREETLQKRLLREKNLDIIKAVEMATTFEHAGHGGESMPNSKKSGSRESTQTSALNFIAGKKSKNFGKYAANGARRATNSRKCFCCGKGNYIATECKYRSYECNICHKVGHLASVCKAKKNKKLYFFINSYIHTYYKYLQLRYIYKVK